jgi:hypothetical protein
MGQNMSFLTRAVIITPFVMALSVSGGCSNDADDCSERLRCGQGGAGGEAGQGGDAGNGGNGGQGGGTPAGCVPADEENPVANTCGIFVSSSLGTAGNAGTKEAPVPTIAEALSISNGKPIYLCGEAFDEAVDMQAGTDVYGALDCANGWAYAPAQKTLVSGPANTIAWKISGAGATTLSDLAITAASATDDGQSSIAMLVDAATVTLERCELTAGDGAQGADAPLDLDDPMLDGGDGQDGSDEDMLMNQACVAATGIIGGGGGQKTCQGTNVNGGRGGAGTPDTTGANGIAGNGPGGLLTGGVPGMGEGAGGLCPGGAGISGNPGVPGAGAMGVGAVSASGYSGIPGGDGLTRGEDGNGAGGGGGANQCGTGNMFSGPSGGGGGSGGCGGAPGVGGSGGGSSIALISLNAEIALLSVTLTAAIAGNGGNGSVGQEGGNGGLPGDSGGTGACAGGQGGNGGRGGAGGGGLGGHSLGIAFKGTEPTRDGGSIEFGMEGLGGEGGDGGPMNQGGNGDNGTAAETLLFE